MTIVMLQEVRAPAFDSLVLAAVAQEIHRELVGGRINAVLQPDTHALGLRLRTRRGAAVLLCSVHPRWARCVLVPALAGRPVHPFAVQMRARLEGGRLRAAAVEPFERVLQVTCETLEGEVRLIIEIMGRHSNLLLVEDGRIAGAFKTVTATMSRVRPIAAGRPYTPPPRGRPTPLEVDAPVLGRWLAGGRPVGETLVTQLLGISPPVADHLALRAGLDPRRPAPPEAAEPLAQGLRDLSAAVATGAFAPVWYEDDGGRPVAYAAFPLLTYQTLRARSTPSMSDATVRVIEAEARAAGLTDQKQALLARIDAAVERAARAEAGVQAHLGAAEDAARWRRWGELLLAYGTTIPPRAEKAIVPDFDGTSVTIPLDPQRSPVANAQAYFRRHAKAAAARRVLPARLAVLRAERAYLDDLGLLAAQAAGGEELRALAQELAEVGKGGRGRTGRGRRPPPSPGPRTFMTTDGLRILVGRTGRENDFVTFTLAAPDDLWLHARGMPGAHVVLKTGGRAPRPEDVETAAAVAAFFSRGRGAATVPVDVTARRHVRKPRGARPGMVHYREERTMTVAPALPEGAVG